jgi:hypothetical protein
MRCGDASQPASSLPASLLEGFSMSGRQLLLTLFHACWLLVLGCGQAAAQQQQAVLERDAQLLAEPRNGAAVVATLKQGASGEVIARKGAWVNLKTPAGTGWLFSFNVRFQEAGAPAARAPAAPARRGPVTATIGIRGLDAEDMRGARFDAAQMGLLDQYATSKQDSEKAARASGLTPARVDYFK